MLSIIIINFLADLCFLLIGYLIGKGKINDDLGVSRVVNGLKSTVKSKPKAGIIRSLSVEELEKRRDPKRMAAEKEIEKEFDKILQNKE